MGSASEPGSEASLTAVNPHALPCPVCREQQALRSHNGGNRSRNRLRNRPRGRPTLCVLLRPLPATLEAAAPPSVTTVIESS